MEEQTEKINADRLDGKEKSGTKWYSRFEDWLCLLSGMIIFSMMALTIIDVLSRTVIGSPITGIYELMEFLLPAAAFMGMSYLQRVRGHIVMSFVSERLSAQKQEIVDLIVLLLSLMIIVPTTWQSALAARDAWLAGDTTTGLIEYPLGPPKAIVSIGCLLLCIRLALQFIASIAGMKRRLLIKT